MKKRFLATTALAAMLLAACGDKEQQTTNDDTAEQTEKEEEAVEEALTVYTTVYPLSYFTERIGGDYVNVQSIYPTGANEHSFEPTQQDMMKLADADLFFYIGLGLEGFVENAEKTLANENVALVPTSTNITEEQLHVSEGHSHDEHEHEEDAHDHGHEGEEVHEDEHDPHVWLSPTIAQTLAATVKDKLVEVMPEQEATFTANYDALIADLQQLDAEFKALSEEVPNKTFFVSHAAFGYIAGAYGFTQVPIAGLNSQSEPSQKELATIVDAAKEQNVKYILFEQNVSSNLAEVIKNEIGAQSLTLHNLSVLTKEDVANDADYLSIMRENIKTLKTALQ
ncbi:metal ABC transporter solute-binding protein, Zn/Mn family [Caryophanon latum]|uniref:Adhesin n=1 Tax=Caryophanon latum TaxID=33977 RepID=A0A1C0Z0E7_9BACL|nr:zinc ABC transporter substrate-binding protein [Caryophanon latum]OCS92907.1 adhesin [Caryophanon latum]